MDYGAVLISVKFQHDLVADAGVYLKKNTLVNAGIPLEQYDQEFSLDGYGQAFIDNLQARNYYFFVKGYSPRAQSIVHGDTSIVVPPRSSLNKDQYLQVVSLGSLPTH